MTTVRVFAYIFGAVSVLAALFFLVLGVVMLVGGGAGVLSARSAAGEFGGLFSGFGAMFGVFGAVFLTVGLMSGLFAWFWLWAGGALGRGSNVARVMVTVIFALDVLSGLFSISLGLAAAQFDGGATLALDLVLTALPVLLIVLLWAPQSARRHFAPTPPPVPPAPWGAVPHALPYAPPPATYGGWPLDASTDRLAPDRAPTPRCRRCGTETERHWVHCGHCGDRLPAVGV